MKKVYVNNGDYTRKNYNIQTAMENLEANKRASERRMKAYDKLPKAVRQTVNEYGQLESAIRCYNRKAEDKVKAIVKSYYDKLERSNSQFFVIDN